MKYIKSTSAYSYSIEGFVIPSMRGKYLTVTTEGYNKLIGNKVFNSLVTTGGIVVYHEKPADMPISNEELLRENAILKAKLAKQGETVADGGEAEVSVDTEESTGRRKRGRR